MPDFIYDDIGQEVRVGDYILTHLTTTSINHIIKKVEKIGKQPSITIDGLDRYWSDSDGQLEHTTRKKFVKVSHDQWLAYEKFREKRKIERGIQ